MQNCFEFLPKPSTAKLKKWDINKYISELQTSKFFLEQTISKPIREFTSKTAKRAVKYVIKHSYIAFLLLFTWIIFRKAVILHRDFFIVLDLRLTKDW